MRVFIELSELSFAAQEYINDNQCPPCGCRFVTNKRDTAYLEIDMFLIDMFLGNHILLGAGFRQSFSKWISEYITTI